MITDKHTENDPAEDKEHLEPIDECEEGLSGRMSSAEGGTVVADVPGRDPCRDEQSDEQEHEEHQNHVVEAQVLRLLQRAGSVDHHQNGDGDVGEDRQGRHADTDLFAWESEEEDVVIGRVGHEPHQSVARELARHLEEWGMSCDRERRERTRLLVGQSKVHR